MKYLFLDTNIFIHYIGYEDIPWTELIHTKDEVSIVLASIIIREIDKHKDSSKGRVKTKARKISQKFKSILLNGLSSRTPLLYCKETPITEEEKKIFDLSVNDDRFLLNVLHSTYNKEDVYVVSNDTDLLLKAKELGLNILSMDETYRSAEGPTDEEKELRKTKEELAKWKNRCSNPKIVFCDNDSECIEFKQYQGCSVEDIVEERVQEEAKKFPEEDDEATENKSYKEILPQQASLQLIWQHTQEEKAYYNKMRYKYLREFREKETLIIKRAMYFHAFKKLKLKIVNKGTAQTGDLHITLKFPKEVKLYNQRESISKYEYEEPVKPQYQRNLLDIEKINQHIWGYNPDYSVKMWNPDKPSNNFEYSSRHTRLTHGLEYNLPHELYIDTEDLQDFVIEWHIADSSLVDHVEGKLRVIVSDKN